MTLAFPKPVKVIKQRKQLARTGFKRKPVGFKSKPTGLKRKPKQASAAEIAYMRGVKSLPCCICQAPPPSDAHHCFHDRYSGARSGHFKTIPLCKRHHQFHVDAIHENKRLWRELHGPDHSFIERTYIAVAALEAYYCADSDSWSVPF